MGKRLACDDDLVLRPFDLRSLFFPSGLYFPLKLVLRTAAIWNCGIYFPPFPSSRAHITGSHICHGLLQEMSVHFQISRGGEGDSETAPMVMRWLLVCFVFWGGMGFPSHAIPPRGGSTKQL